jgi:hypothetical protein
MRAEKYSANRIKEKSTHMQKITVRRINISERPELVRALETERKRKATRAKNALKKAS